MPNLRVEGVYKQAKINERQSMHRFLIVIEKAGKNFSAYSPDLPRCVATEKTRAEGQTHDAIGIHIRGLLEDGLPVPKSHSSAAFIAVHAE